MFYNKNRIITLTLFLFTFCISIPNVFAAECVDYKNGSGTESDPYEITTSEELYSINCNLNSHFVLKNDLDLSNDTTKENGLFYNDGKGWIAIGGKDSVFSGVFDGNNKTITGMKQVREFNSASNDGLNYGGLFRNVSGTVKNLNLTNIDINFNEKTNVGVRLGAISAYSSGQISNVTVTGQISYTGNMGNLSAYSPYSIGGIVGYTSSNGSITNCTNEANITVDASIDGNLAGITGELYSGTINGCINKGNIVGNQNAGGITDSLSNQSDTYMIVSNSYNYGKIKADYAGGIVSTMAGNVKISECGNYGTIEVEELGGGIASLVVFSGMNTVGYIEKSFNAGTIYSHGSAGGIAGSSVMEINNSYNIGKIYLYNSGVEEYAGGIVGRTGGVSNVNIAGVKNSYSIGMIDSLNPKAKIGNIVGNANSNITNSYYLKNQYDGVGILNDEHITGSGIDNSKELTPQQFLNTSSFVGFDFDNIWNTNKNSTYPLPQINNNNLEGTYIKAIDLMYNNKIYIGEKIKVNYELTPSDTTYKNIIWSVENDTGEGTVDSNGDFIGTKVGKVTIIATSRDFPVVCGELEIEILPIPIDTIRINERLEKVSLNNEYIFTTTILPNNTTNKDVIWSVENGTGEGTIDSNGKFIGTKTGFVTIVATSSDNNDIKDSIEIEIIDVGIKEIQIKADSLYVDNYSSFYLKAIASPSNTSLKNVTWNSSDTSIATIDAKTGAVSTSYKKGIVTFTATSTSNSEIKGNITIYVGYTNVKLGNETSLGNSFFTQYDEVIWEIENEDILEPTGRTGSTSVNSNYRHYIYVRGKANGETTVKMKTISGEVIATSIVRVYTPIDSMTSNLEKLFIGVGAQKKLEIQLAPENISENLDNLIYYSEDSSIAEVDSNGNVYAKSIGSTIITVYSQYYNKKITIPVVVETYPSSVDIKNTDINLNDENRTHQIEYTISPNNVTNQKIIFASEDSGIASVSKEGLITALKNGTTKIIVKNANNEILKELSITIMGLKTDITEFNVSGIEDVIYDGTEKKLNIKIDDGTYYLVENTDYEIIYENNLNVGKATLTIKGINYFKGTINLSFNINPATIEYTSLGKTVVYDGNSYEISLDVITEGVTIKYANENGEYILDSMPKYSDAGIYEIKYELTKSNYTTIKSSNLLTIEKADIKYSYNEREDYFDGYPSNLGHGNFSDLWVFVSKPAKDYVIKYQDKNGNYTLDVADVPTKAGDMLINFQISAKNFNTIQSSMYRRSYGILNMHDSLRLTDWYLRVRDYTTNFNKLLDKFNVYSTNQYSFRYEHRDANNNVLINSPIKTGDRFVMLFSGDLIFHDWSISLLGDVNCDGKISALDYVKIKNHIMQTNYINSSWAMDAADLNEDGKISALDYVRVKNYIMNGGK